jgi:hypothetical protein
VGKGFGFLFCGFTRPESWSPAKSSGENKSSKVELRTKEQRDRKEQLTSPAHGRHKGKIGGFLLFQTLSGCQGVTSKILKIFVEDWLSPPRKSVVTTIKRVTFS